MLSEKIRTIVLASSNILARAMTFTVRRRIDNSRIPTLESIRSVFDANRINYEPRNDKSNRNTGLVNELSRATIDNDQKGKFTRRHEFTYLLIFCPLRSTGIPRERTFFPSSHLARRARASETRRDFELSGKIFAQDSGLSNRIFIFR